MRSGEIHVTCEWWVKWERRFRGYVRESSKMLSRILDSYTKSVFSFFAALGLPVPHLTYTVYDNVGLLLDRTY